jgi:hypothetical protein
MLVRFGNDETSIVPPSLGELVPQVMLVTLAREESDRVGVPEEALWLLEALLVRAVDVLPRRRFTAPVKTARKPVIVPDKPEAKVHNAFSRGHTSVEPRYTAMTSVVPFSIFLA